MEGLMAAVTRRVTVYPVTVTVKPELLPGGMNCRGL